MYCCLTSICQGTRALTVVVVGGGGGVNVVVVVVFVGVAVGVVGVVDVVLLVGMPTSSPHRYIFFQAKKNARPRGAAQCVSSKIRSMRSNVSLSVSLLLLACFIPEACSLFLPGVGSLITRNIFSDLFCLWCASFLEDEQPKEYAVINLVVWLLGRLFKKQKTTKQKLCLLHTSYSYVQTCYRFSSV